MAERFALKVELRTPLLGLPATLDGLLAGLIFDATQSIEQAHSEIPLARTAELWHGSAGFLEDAVPLKASLVASLRAQHDLDIDLVARRGGKLPRVSDKRAREFGPVLSEWSGHAARAVWWFGEGDVDAVGRLLTDVRHLGKKRAQGFGEVVTFDLAPARTNGVVANDREPLRPIPVEMQLAAPESVVAEAAWRPAYWKPHNRTACHIPASVLRSSSWLNALLDAS